MQPALAFPFKKKDVVSQLSVLLDEGVALMEQLCGVTDATHSLTESRSFTATEVHAARNALFKGEIGRWDGMTIRLTPPDPVLDELVHTQTRAIKDLITRQAIAQAFEQWDALKLTLGLHGIQTTAEGLANWPGVRHVKALLDRRRIILPPGFELVV